MRGGKGAVDDLGRYRVGTVSVYGATCRERLMKIHYVLLKTSREKDGSPPIRLQGANGLLRRIDAGPSSRIGTDWRYQVD